MRRLLRAALAASSLGLALVACAPRIDSAQQKTFDACMAGVAREFPDSVRPGVKIVERRQAEAIGNYKEDCMTNLGYRYDESKAGCRRPPSWDPDYPRFQSDVTCYALRS
jgi:hypothetical protein